jgi:hypothetical protein
MAVRFDVESAWNGIGRRRFAPRRLKLLGPCKGVHLQRVASKSSEPLTQRVASGDSASRQAVTRVNAEQASKDQEAGPGLVVFQGRPRSCGSGTTSSHTIPPA